MFRSIFLKTIYEKRWGIVGWSGAMFLMALFVVVLFPIFKDSFGAQLSDVPESMRAILGEAADYQKLSGFLELQVFAQMVFLTFIYGIILSVSLLAGEESKGTLQTLLTLPVSRTNIYWHKFLAILAILSLVSLALFLSVVVGAAIISEPISYSAAGQATFMQWLLGVSLSALAFSIGAATGRRVVAGTVAGVYTFAAYTITALAGTAEFLQTMNHFSIFKYLVGTRILENGIMFADVWPMVVFTVLALLGGWAVFVRRNVYQQ